MTGDGAPRRRRLPWWLILAVIIVVIVSVPALRHTIGIYLAHAAAVIVGVFITLLVLLGAGRTPPRR